MRYFIIALLMLSQATWAQRNLNQETYRIKVRPVLSGIVGDFYQMIALFPQYPKEMALLVREMDALALLKENLTTACPRELTKACAESLTTIRQKLSKLRDQSLTLQSRVNFSADYYITTISGFRIITEYDAKLESVKSVLDTASFLMKAQIPQKLKTYKLVKELDELDTILSLAVVEFIPFTYRSDFRQFYLNFIHPIQIHLSKRDNPQFLYRNLNSLNFAVNLLNMTLTKRKKTPEGMGSYLAVIHNRWNSLLRYYF